MSSDIEKVVSKYVELEDHGSVLKACCPFPDHNENTPSFTVYPDTESVYCFGCAKGGDAIEFIKGVERVEFKKAKGVVEEILGKGVDVGDEKKRLTRKTTDFTPMPHEAIKEFQSDKVFQKVNYRGIRQETDRFFRTLSKVDEKGNVIARYYPETRGGKLAGYKCRNHPKDFTYGKVGTTGVNNDLSGQHLFQSGGKYVLFCGGEEDKAAAYQMFLDHQRERNQEEFSTMPVVSPTSGEGSAANQAAKQYDWFDTFDIIVLGLDNDAAGRKAAQEVAEVLPKEKVRIATWNGKDPNDMLTQGKGKQFIRDFYNAKEYVASGIKTSKDADEEIELELSREKVPLPPFMSKLQHIMAGGIAMGYIVNLGAQTGGGKTTIANEMIYYWIFNSPHKIGILSLELNAGQYQLSMLSRHIGRKIQLIEDPKEALEFVGQDWVQEKRRELRENEFGQERYALLDERDGGLEQVKLQINKLIKKHGCKLIIIDPVNDLFEGCTIEAQTDFIKYLKGVVKDGISIFNICHITKGKTEIDRDGKRRMRQLTEDDFAGVSNLAKSGGCNFFATRDKYAEDPVEQNTTHVEVPKCRWTGRAGNAGYWYYDNATHTLYDKDEWMAGMTNQDSIGYEESYIQGQEIQEEMDINDIL